MKKKKFSLSINATIVFFCVLALSVCFMVSITQMVSADDVKDEIIVSGDARTTYKWETYTSGKCGASTVWDLSGESFLIEFEDGYTSSGINYLLLSIGGTGEMRDYTYKSNPIGDDDVPPWKLTQAVGMNRSIQKIVVHDGVTKIGDYAFCWPDQSIDDHYVSYRNVAEVSIAPSVKEIGYNAFRGLWNLKKVVIPEGVITISTNAFLNCTRLGEVFLSDSVASISPYAFNNCSDNLVFNVIKGSYAQSYCEENGFKYRLIRREDFPIDEHSWEDHYTVDKEPTCTEEGKKSIHCTTCKETKDTIVIPPAEHAWEVISSKYEKYSSTQHIEAIVYECKECGQVKTENVYMDHNWKQVTKYEKHSKKKHLIRQGEQCKDCGEFIVNDTSTKAHSSFKLKTIYDSWVGELAWETSTKLKKIYYCKKCKQKVKATSFKSTKPSVASIDKKGKIRFKKAGTTTIKAKIGGKWYSHKLKVKGVPCYKHSNVPNFGKVYGVSVKSTKKEDCGKRYNYGKKAVPYAKDYVKLLKRQGWKQTGGGGDKDGWDKYFKKNGREMGVVFERYGVSGNYVWIWVYGF